MRSPAILTLAALPVFAAAALGQQAASSEIAEGLKSSFSLPLREWFGPRTDGKREHPLRGFSIAPSVTYPLSKVAVAGSQGVGNQGQEQAATPTIAASVKYSPITSWFAETTFYGYPNPAQQKPWNPDFSYTFGYDDWHPYTLSLVYSNYGGNRFHPNYSKNEPVSVVPQGNIALGWKFQLPKPIEDQLRVSPAGTMGWNVAYNITPRYTDAQTLAERGPKQFVTLGYRNQFYGNFYGNVTLYGYFHYSQEQPWNPDFTYGFGYFDYRPGKFSFEYNNYSGNRFPWRRRSAGTGTLGNGAFSISWNWAWSQ